ncbi:ABC transporter permease [Reinekea marinisedimentorum]|uniref:NitT/TauT family transport system permease protein n=1 Tax=Reinekea marinisedimentorum TaxID=230495 RepID=A0A4R3HT73_9GAMM|nr:ABC transporter permease [Reinekea marinisedimentorum]TCS36396.1 NitT/TauT family transport system permease protein [Reinekea marinisedimentorum]
MNQTPKLLIYAAVLFAQVALAFFTEPGFYERAPLLLFLLLASFFAAAGMMSACTALVDANHPFKKSLKIAVPSVFALVVVVSWQALTQGYDVPQVLLPAPSEIIVAFFSNLPTLWADFRQTFLKAVIAGYLMGCISGFIVAQWAVKSRFLQNGLLPLGNFVSAIPIVGIAPIMVMWFGFDWPSKAAVVVVMTFFPMFINTLAGLQSVDALHKDLMHTYAAKKSQTFTKSQLPQAMPFIFNALKLNSTLALIGAIVAEFFGTPIVGMGFRISTEVGRMNMEMVWATILVAALAGSMSYGALALLERAVLFWHPSVRSGR